MTAVNEEGVTHRSLVVSDFVLSLVKTLLRGGFLSFDVAVAT